jgi:glycosyltransferase involved in cell wall biosynthesis
MPDTSLSLVIPAYNVECYIHEALESVRLQLSPFTEVIIINDGSTDNTLDIIKEYIGLPGWHVLSTKNMGLGAARNLGARVSSSEYLMFLDADDYIDVHLAHSFYQESTLNPLIDLYAFSFVSFEDSAHGKISIKKHQYHSRKSSQGCYMLADLIKSSSFYSPSWSYVFRKSLINWSLNGFYGILHEDEELTPRLFVRSKHVVLTSKSLYFYRQRSGSIMNSSGILRFYRSRFGYFVALLSNLVLLVSSVGNMHLLGALWIRTRYLSYHAFFPLCSGCKSFSLYLLRKCILRS